MVLVTIRIVVVVVVVVLSYEMMGVESWLLWLGLLVSMMMIIINIMLM